MLGTASATVWYFPWVAILHADATHTTRSGIYVIYLFRADIPASTEPLLRLGTTVGLAWVRERAAELRTRIRPIAASGFELHHAIDLRSDISTAQHYTASTIAHRFYDRTRMPENEALKNDIGALLTCYAGLVQEKTVFRADLQRQSP